VRRHNNWKFLLVIKIFKARLLATTYANDKALVTTGLTQYTEKAKQKHCQHNIVAVPYLFYQPASLLWFINSKTTKQEVSTTPIEILFVDYTQISNPNMWRRSGLSHTKQAISAKEISKSAHLWTQKTSQP
jgi:predicted GNAT family acetyltransferase